MKTNLFRKNHSSPKWGMRIMRLALLLLPLLGRGLGGGCVLFAQNGVTVSGLAINAGTVTFNVSWKNTNMPELWSDTVWVFVDYNNAGVMERLPLLPGATLTETSAPGVGKVVAAPGNNQGVWVVGNARNAGSFSATVQLPTVISGIGGACVYGSNYPPVGKYTSATEISFIGTPEYEVVLERFNKSTYTVTVHKDESLPIPSGEAVLSFTDKTGTPGKITYIPSTVYDLEVSASDFCEGSVGVTFALSGTDSGQHYELYRNGTTVVATLEGTGSAATFSDAMNVAGTYSARTILGGAFYPAEMSGIHTITAATATPANSTVNFTAFNPCSGAATGTVWYLTDTREAASTNTAARARTYKVKKLQDGRIWMVQDLKFGDRCDKTAFRGSDGGDQTGKLSTVFTGYYGDCRNNTQANAGYMYDWAAAMNKAGAHAGSSNSSFQCTGIAFGSGSPNPSACQGICPNGWHIPTGNTAGEFYDLHNNYGRGCVSDNGDCWNASSTWEGVLGGGCVSGTLYNQGNYGRYWSSTYYDSSYAYNLCFYSDAMSPGIHGYYKNYGFSVRCVRNY